MLDDGVMINGEKTEMPFEILQIFKRLRDAEGYYQQARGVIFRAYVYSDNLIRTERNSKINVSKMQGLVNRLNTLMDGAYSLRYNVIHQSGIFYRAHLLECESTQFNLEDPEFASKVFCEDLSSKVKNAVPVPVTRDLLQEKQTEVARLARQASEAVDIVTRTMNELEGINQQIDNDLAEIDTYSKELAATRAAMSQQRKNNTAIIANFAKLLDTCPAESVSE